MRLIVPVYRRRASALHAARAGASACYCLALALVCMLYENPLVLGAVLLATVAAGVLAGVGAELRRALVLAIPVALLFTIVNPLVYTQGQTLLVRGDEVLGHRFDITLEALVFGAVAGLRIAVLIMIFGLFSAAVDPDRLLQLVRRVSYRSALTAALATRLVPVLARDATRMGDAARCRPHRPARATVARAALSGALERSVDLAAALEVRGYASAHRPRRVRTPWSRHDLAVATSAAGVAAVAIGGVLAEVGGFEPYPTLSIAAGPGTAVICGAIVAAALLPFAGPAARRGIAPRAPGVAA